MVKINKTPLPVDVTIRTEDDYRSGVVYEQLKKDCCDKRYICEWKKLRPRYVEHLVPKKVNPNLKYEWSNLLLSCAYCNTLKSDRFSNVIDPTKVYPELFIELSVDNGYKRNIVVSFFDTKPQTKETVELINLVYNGEITAMGADNSSSLRDDVFSVVSEFNELLITYKEETDKHVKDELFNRIVSNILRESEFATFKRKIVREDVELIDMLKTFLETE